MESLGLRVHAGHAPLSLAGEVSATEAWRELERNPDAWLLDVRTIEEWALSGEPDLRSLGKDALRISWDISASSEASERLAAFLSRAGIKKDAPLLFLSRSGVRSRAAAAALAAHGYTCYALAEGFDSSKDGHGWTASGLPWRQR